MDFSVRKATADDCSVLAAFLQRLVSLRNEPGLITQNDKDLYRDGFAKNKHRFAAVLAESSGPDKEVIGFALYSYRYHSFVGRGLHLNNLFVLEPHRGKGVATQLLKRVIREGLKQGCHNMGFMSNSWNHIAKNLYKKMGAINMTETYGLHAYEYVTQHTCTRHAYPLDCAVIRKARPDDVAEMTRLLKLYKNSQNVCMLENTEENVLRENGFDKSPKFFAYVAEKQSANPGSEKRLVGILTYSYAYCSHSSTTISMDAVYVEESYRREGIACALFNTCRMDEAEKNHTKIRFFVDSSIDTARDFFRHVNGVDQSERAQWIWSIVPHDDLSSYVLTDGLIENSAETNLTTVEALPNGETSSKGFISNFLKSVTNGVANGDASMNGYENGDTSDATNDEDVSLNGSANGKVSFNGLANGDTSLNGEASGVSNGDASLNGLPNGDASFKNGGGSLKSLTNGGLSLKSVSNGDAPIKSSAPLKIIANGYVPEGVVVNGETTNL